MMSSVTKWQALLRSRELREREPGGDFRLSMASSSTARNIRSIRGQGEIRLRLEGKETCVELTAWSDETGEHIEIQTGSGFSHTTRARPTRDGNLTAPFRPEESV